MKVRDLVHLQETPDPGSVSADIISKGMKHPAFKVIGDKVKELEAAVSKAQGEVKAGVRAGSDVGRLALPVMESGILPKLEALEKVVSTVVGQVKKRALGR